MIKMYLFIKRNRFRKKWKLLKQLILLSFDFTSLFYALLFLGYIIVAIYHEGNMAFNFDQKMLQFEMIAIDSFWYIVTIIPLVRLFGAFQSPGIIFSSAEYQLTILPHSKAKVWLIVTAERWLKALLIYFIVGTVIFLLTPVTLSLIVAYLSLLTFLNIVMTTVEWKFFQLPVLIKIAVIVVLMIVNGISLLVASPMLAIAFLVFLTFLNIYMAKRLFIQIDWQKVTAANDYKLWRMIVISYATKTKFKKERKYSIWQRMSFWKEPFPYDKSTLYHRLWHLYLEKNIGLILQLSGALLLMLFAFSFLREWLFLLAIIITIHIYTTFAVALFKDRLESDIVQALPWDMEVFRNTYQIWVLVSGSVFLIPYFVYILNHFNFWIIAQAIVTLFAFYLLLHLKLNKVIMEVNKEYQSQDWLFLFGYGLLLIILFSHQYPVFLLLGCLIVGMTPFFLPLKKSTVTY